MGIWRNFLGYFKREKKSDAALDTPRAGAVPLFLRTGGNAMCVATVFRCVRLLSESVASLPLLHERLRDGIFTDTGDSGLYYLLNVQPDDAVNAFDFWRQVVQEMLLDGNAYIVPQYSDARLDRLALCSRGTVQHDSLNDTYHVADSTCGIFGTFREEEIIHIKGMTLADCKRGVSVLAYARHTVDTARAGDTETYSRFANGGDVRGIISDGSTTRGFGKLQDEELSKTARVIDKLFRRGNRIVNIPGQLDFKQLSMSSADMQFLESRKFTVREICRFFGVHPSFVFDDTSNNYKSAEQANAAFLSHTLAPLLINIEKELCRKLVAPSLCRSYRIRFDRRGLHACDLDGMMAYRTRLLQTGSSVNEVRRMDNLPPVPGGDVPLVSANLRGINECTTQDNDEK
ncbi:MAG: phage portal protein [Muribaculaceae bacterium]|nr:phage portal protein [Muribaculaceae bacterium]